MPFSSRTFWKGRTVLNEQVVLFYCPLEEMVPLKTGFSVGFYTAWVRVGGARWVCVNGISEVLIKELDYVLEFLMRLLFSALRLTFQRQNQGQNASRKYLKITSKKTQSCVSSDFLIN